MHTDFPDPLTDTAFAVRCDLGDQMAKYIRSCSEPTTLSEVEDELVQAIERATLRLQETRSQLARLQNIPLLPIAGEFVAA